MHGSKKDRSRAEAGFIRSLCMVADVEQTSKRRTLVFLGNISKTPEEIKHTRGLVAGWLRLHPEDEIVKRVSRQLDRSEQRLRQAGEWH